MSNGAMENKMTAAHVAVIGLALTFLPSLAGAQVPSYAKPSYGSDEETLHGRVKAIPGTFELVVRDDRGFDDDVRLHQGTVINPTGLTLTPGMSVRILGYNHGRYFSANEIDTPYDYAGPAYVEPYYYPPYPYYPGYYGPGYYGGTNVIIAPSFGWGWGGGWHRRGW